MAAHLLARTFARSSLKMTNNGVVLLIVLMACYFAIGAGDTCCGTTCCASASTSCCSSFGTGKIAGVSVVGAFIFFAIGGLLYWCGCKEGSKFCMKAGEKQLEQAGRKIYPIHGEIYPIVWT